MGGALSTDDSSRKQPISGFSAKSWAWGVLTWAALVAKLRDDKVSPADAASGDRLHTSITFEDPHRESCSTCVAARGW